MSEVIPYERVQSCSKTDEIINRLAQVPMRQLLDGGHHVTYLGTQMHIAEPFEGPSWRDSGNFVVKLSGFASLVNGLNVIGGQAMAEVLQCPVVSLASFPSRPSLTRRERGLITYGNFRPYVDHLLSAVEYAKKDYGPPTADGRIHVTGVSLGAAVAPMFGQRAANRFEVGKVVAKSPCNTEPCDLTSFLHRLSATRRRSYTEALFSAEELNGHVDEFFELNGQLGATAIKKVKRTLQKESNACMRSNPELTLALIRGFTQGKFLRDLDLLLSRGIETVVACGTRDGFAPARVVRQLEERAERHSTFNLYTLEGDHAMWGMPRWISWFTVQALADAVSNASPARL